MNHRYSKAAGALLLALTMTACHSAPPSTVTTVATMPEETKSTLAAVQVQGGDELTKLLDQIEDNVFPGTAGCTLTSVQYTVNLLDWCKTAGVSDSELRGIVSNWMAGKDTAELSRKFELVSDTYQKLMSDTAADLLDAAGVRTDSCPWPEACRQVMATILEVTGADSTVEDPLETVLTDIRDDWDGTDAGSTRQAAKLLDWAADTGLTEEEVRTALVSWLSPMGNDEQAAFASSLARVGSVCKRLLTDEGPALLENAEMDLKTWPESAIEAVNVLLEASGANEIG